MQQAREKARRVKEAVARCLRVGGVKPKAELRVSSGELIYVSLSQGLARELGTRLYDEVVLEGKAVWDLNF